MIVSAKLGWSFPVTSPTSSGAVYYRPHPLFNYADSPFMKGPCERLSMARQQRSRDISEAAASWNGCGPDYWPYRSRFIISPADIISADIAVYLKYKIITYIWIYRPSCLFIAQNDASGWRSLMMFCTSDDKECVCVYKMKNYRTHGFALDTKIKQLLSMKCPGSLF